MNRQPHHSPQTRNRNADEDEQQRTAKKALSNINKVLNATAQKNDAQSERSKRLAKELEDFVERGMKGVIATERGEEGAPSIEAATELQIQIARMFRQVCGTVLRVCICVYAFVYACASVLSGEQARGLHGFGTPPFFIKDGLHF